jgi:hypothetical protein
MRERARATYAVGELPERYTAVRISTRGRSEYEALEAALDAMDLLRGMWWNLRLGSLARMSGGRPEPVNRLVLGPVHTLHEPKGTLTEGLFWYESNYLGPVRVRTPRVPWGEVREFERTIRGQLSRCSYREKLEDLIRQYTRALDSRDWNGDFIRLWGALEQLTLAETGQDAVKRAIFLYNDRDRAFGRQALKHLRIYRNRTVQAGRQETEEIETLLYQLKRYVDDLLLFHIRSAGLFASFERAVQLLNQPPHTEVLQDRIDSLKKALQYHH